MPNINDSFPSNYLKASDLGGRAVVGDVVEVVGGEKGKPILLFCESLAQVMFRFTSYVMHFAPFGVGAAMAVTISKMGIGVLVNLGMLIGTLYVS